MAIDKQHIEARLNQGLLGQWYVVAKSNQVQPQKPFATKALGISLVLWRATDGRVHCLEDRCPHRGARLSQGNQVEDDLACRYHGIVIDADGVIVRVPAMPDCILEGRQAVKSFIVQEHRDAIFAYFSSEAYPEPPSLELPYELMGDDYASFMVTGDWGCNYRYALENIADPMHGCYLHADTFTLSGGSKDDLIELEKRADGFLVSRVGQRDQNFDWTEVVLPEGNLYCRLDIPYPVPGGPGGPMRILTYITPIDETSCRIFFWRTRKVSGLARESWRFLYRATFEPRHWTVLEQDREMLEALLDDARDHEMLYQHDAGVSRLRVALAKRARAQLDAEAAVVLQAAQ
jgi:phenylpropionate dioxygenase-like ring-hydroxylating dioxygenase large terminal subunit